MPEILFFAAFLITFVLVPCFIKLAHSFGIIDIPDGKLKNHKEKIPYLGGLAIYSGFMLTLLVCRFIHLISLDYDFILILTALSLLIIIGLVDDFLIIKPYQKFIGQAVSALILIKAGVYLGSNINPALNYLSIIASVFWLLSIMNAFNLIDVMDGLATTSAIFASLGFLSVVFALGHNVLIISLILFLGALCAFLFYNKPNARIYLGDTGSLFIGGFLGTISLILIKNLYGLTHNYMVMIIPIFILAIPILELISLIIIRTYKKIPIYLGSPDHFSIYLQRKGWSKYKILIFVSLYSVIFFSIICLFMLNYIGFTSFLLSTTTSLLVWCKFIY